MAAKKYDFTCIEETKLYTLEEAERILNRRKIMEENNKKRIRNYFIKQKLCGMVIVAAGIFCPIVTGGDATFSLLAFPIGFGLLLSKQKIMTF